VGHAVISGVILLIVWLLWSGLSTPGTHHYHPMLLKFGIASCIFSVYLSRRMKILDDEGQPHLWAARFLMYLPWIVKEIIVSNIDVTKRVLSPTLNISPTLTTVKMSQKTDLGKVLYANSITLTPGTIALYFDETNETLTVHALTREGAEGLKDGEMDRRCKKVEGS